MKRQLYGTMAALMVASTSLVAGSALAANHQNASAKPPKLQRGVTLKIEDFFDTAKKDDPGRIVMEKIANQWAAKTHNKVEFLGHPDNSQNKMCVDAPNGNGPDLIGTPHDQISIMTTCSSLASVPEWAWPAKVRAGYIKAALQGTNIGGKYYAMPWAIETTGLWYNKSLISPSAFKTAHGKPLAWKSLIPKLQKLTDTGAGRYGLGWKIDDFYFDFGTIANTGGYVFKFTKRGFDYHNVGLDTPGAIKGISFLRDISTAGKYKIVPASFTGSNGYSQAESLFDSGKMAVWLTGPWAKENMIKGNINIGFAPLPSVDGKNAAHPFSGVQAFAVNKFSQHGNEAMSLLSYLTQNMQMAEFKTQGRIPVINKYLHSKSVQSDAVSRGLASAVASARPMPNIPEMSKVWDPMAKALTLVVKGQLSPSAAAHEAVKKIKADIAALHGS